MSDIEELERRIAAALDRIGSGVEGLSAESGDAEAEAVAREEDLAEISRLTEALAAEKDANAQLEARVQDLRDKQDTVIGTLQDEVQQLREGMTHHDSDVQRIKRVNAQLRANNASLREANEAGVSDPHLINKAMLSELEALRVSHEADRAEMDAILAELKPLVSDDQENADA
jgi:chromosome segregation ATPase